MGIVYVHFELKFLREEKSFGKKEKKLEPQELRVAEKKAQHESRNS